VLCTGWASIGASKQQLSHTCHPVHPHRLTPPIAHPPGGPLLVGHSSSPRPRIAHALMHAPANIGWRSRPPAKTQAAQHDFEPEFEQAGGASIARASPARSARCWASEASAPAAPTAGARSPTTTGSSRSRAGAAGPTPAPLAGPVACVAPELIGSMLPVAAVCGLRSGGRLEWLV
jgi:hypothetical protein